MIVLGILAWVLRSGGSPSVHGRPVQAGLTPPQVMNALASNMDGAPVVATVSGAQPEPVKPSGYASLGTALAAVRHAVEPLDPAGPHARGARYFAANPEQQLRMWFSNDGVELASGIAAPDGEEPWSLKMRLLGAGREDAMTPVTAGSVTGEGSRVEMKYHNPSVSQWFENRKDGMEQGFTLMQAPAGGAGGATIMLEIVGSLRAVAACGGDGVRFVDAAGDEVLHYAGLKAWDADGRALAARMELHDSIGESGRLALVIADAGARYPITVDPLFANVEARLIERSVAQDYFGSAVALAGDTAVIGAPFEDTLGHADAGSAYVFVRNANKWRLQAKLTADDLADEDFYGDSVAISGDTVVVGADWADVGDKANAGKAYIFTRNGAVWSQQAKLTAGDATAHDHFGTAVAVSGDTAVVGAPAADTAGGMDAGCAYVYVRTGEAWEQQKQLKAYDAAEGDAFGSAVAVDGATAVVGAPGDDKDTLENAGSAYVFVRSGTAWNHEDQLLAPVAAAAAGFGCSVAVSGDTAVVGAKGDDTPAGADAGSAHVYLRSGVVWNHQATLLLDGAAAGDAFGSVVALDGDTAVIGAPRHASNGMTGSGSAAVFTRTGDMWSERAMLTATDPATGDSFGAAVAVSGGTVLVGALGSNTEAGLGAGSARVFVNSGTTWNPQAELLAENSPAGDLFGVSVALSADTALVGAFNDDTPAGAGAGSAYVFVRSGMLWAQEAKLSAGSGAAGDAFGASVAISGDTAIIGASGANTPGGVDAGSVSVFIRSGTGWVEQQVLMASDGAAGDHFGCCLALDGDTALIGAVGDDTPAGTDAGSCYVFRLTGGSWQQETQLHADDAAVGDGFGGAVALDGDTALVGASRSNTTAGMDAGQAYVFTRSGVTWTQQARLVAPDGAADDRFGGAVALSNHTALVGASRDSGPGGLQAGSAHVFVRDGVNWSAQAKLTASDAAPGEGFGFAVSVDGDTALVGAPLASLPAGSNAGSAYLYYRNGTVWSEQLKLTSGVDASAGDQFGNSVALSGDTAIIAAYADATAGPGAGSAYIYLIGALPVITQQPQSKTVVPGQAVTFTVVAMGYEPLHFQWRWDGFPIESAVASSYVIPSAQVANQGSYDCVVSNIGGVATSAPAVLTVNALSQFSQVFPGVPPSAMGKVYVTLTPPGVGGWRFSGEQQWRASGVPVSGLTTGDRVIECMPVNGYIQPPPEPVSVISGAAATFITLPYYATGQSGSGGLSVILKPDALADPGVPDEERAQWRLFKPGINFDPWLNSGEVLDGLIAGGYLVECKAVAGRGTPPPGIVRVDEGSTSLIRITYFLEEAQTGAAPTVLPFETVATSGNMPYAYVGQIRSDAGSSSGFVVKPRVVATAGHVVFDDGTLSAVTGMQWLFQRDTISYEPKPQIPRGVYLLDDYAAARSAPGVVPGEGTLESQNRDAAVLYFLEDAGRGGYAGFLASDATDNEFLVSSAQKILAGYPVDALSGFVAGRMHATPAMNARFTRVPAVDASGNPFRTYTTGDIRGSGGMSGGPLCVQFEGLKYYPAAIYLGGSGQTVVRSIDSKVIDIFNRAELSSVAGGNNTAGGITFTSFSTLGASSEPGGIKVTIEPEAARTAGAGWLLKPGTSYQPSGNEVDGLTAGSRILQLKTVAGFQVPAEQSVTIKGGQLLETTYTYVEIVPPPAITSANAVAVTRGQLLNYLIVASHSPQAYSLSGTLPAGLAFNASNGLISGTPLEAGAFTVTVGATNTGGTGTMALTLTSRPSVPNQGRTVPLGQPLDFQFVSSESGAGVSYTATGLPSGVSLNPTSGRVTGSPLLAGVFASPVTVTKAGAGATATLTLTVTATPLEIWRLANFPTTYNTGSAADGADPDHDGQSNLSEYAAGTDPNNPSEMFRVLSSRKSGTTFTLSTSGKAGRTYTLQRRTDLAAGNWATVFTTGPLPADETVDLADPAAPAGKAFYRIQVAVP